MNFIKSIQKICVNKKIIKYFFIFFVVYYLSSDISFATENIDQMVENTSTIAEGLLKWISMILALFTYLTTVFLSPAWINWGLFWLNGYFKEIWILVSNLVYFVFAFILIWIAFMNIIWKSADQYQLKQALPKFIVWVLIVPFSWFLVQFILSLSAVLTVASLSLPFDTFDKYEKSLDKVSIPKECTLDLRSFLDKGTAWNETTEDTGYFSCTNRKNPSEAISINEIAWAWKSIDSIFWIIAMYSYGVLSLDTIDGVDKVDLGSVKTMWDLIVKIVFDLLFVFIYSILMIAIWMVLMIRWIYIWIYIMISPVFWLMYFFGKKDWWWNWFFSKFNIKEFIALAMVPVYTMLALSFWLLFLFIVWSWMSGTSTFSQGSAWSDVKVWEDNIQVWQFKLNIKWQVSKLDNATWFMKEVWWAWLWIVWSLILKVFGIVILWWTIMAAMSTSKITEAIIKPLQDFWEKVGWIITSAPWNIPIFPTWKWGMQSMRSLSQAWSTIESVISSKGSVRASILSNQLWFGNDKVTDNMNSIKSRIPWANNDEKRAWLAKEMLKWVDWDANKLHNNPLAKENLYELWKIIIWLEGLKWININSSNDINDTNKIAELYKAIEAKWWKFVDILPEANWGINGAAIQEAVKRYKENANNSNWEDSTNNNTNPPNSWWNSTVNVSINNNKIQNINWIDRTPEQFEKIQGLSINTFTKQEFIKQLQEPDIWLDITKATSIAEKIPDINFNSNPTN